MWAQLITSKIRPGKEEEARNLPQEFDADMDTSAPPWVSITTSVNQKDPTEYYTLVVFESEEAARANEGSPEQAKRVQRMMEIFDGQPKFVDMDVLYHRTR